MDHDPYGLTDRPFQLTPDPRFYFESATHRKAMTYLGYGLAQGEGFIVVTGEVGTGKTMLVGRLMATIDRSRLTAINLVSTQLEGEDILRIVALALGVAADAVAKGQLLARIERYLHEQARSGKRTLLIVDEAQNLPSSALEELRMLSNFQYGGQALLQTFLLGQPEFREALAQPRFEQLRQRVIATHHLTAMNPEETAPYVMHRLACAGWKGMPRFSQGAYDALHKLSGGVPRKLNVLAGRVMLQGAIERLTDIDEDVVEDVAADLVGESIMPAEGPAPMAQAMPYSFPAIPPGTPASPPPQWPAPAQAAAPQQPAYEPPAYQPAPQPVQAPPAAVAPPVAAAPPPVAAQPSPEPQPFVPPAYVPPAPPVEAPRPPSSYTSYAPPEDAAPQDPYAQSGEAFAALPEVPPPAIAQPPRYDGVVPPEAAPQPIAEVPPAPAVEAPQPAPVAAQPVAPEPAPSYAPPAPASPDGGEADYAARNAELEARLAEQEAILRRTLSLLVELVETDQQPGPEGEGGNQNAA